MIVASLLLILVAVVLLGVGLARGDNASLIGSIAASLLAAITLVVGARQLAGDRIDEPDEFDDGSGHMPDDEDDHGDLAVVTGGPEDRTERSADPAAPPVEIPVQAGAPAGQDADDEDPPDEPPPQVVSPADAERVAQMSAEVLVIDGRPRYHLADCEHLRGRESEPLPVSEAVELGFTPCGRCEPVSALLAEVSRP